MCQGDPCGLKGIHRGAGTARHWAGGRPLLALQTPESTATWVGPEEVYCHETDQSRVPRNGPCASRKDRYLDQELSLRQVFTFPKLHRVLDQAGLPWTHGRGLEGFWALSSYVRPSGNTGRACSVQTDLHASQVSKQKDLQSNRLASASGSVRMEQSLVLRMECLGLLSGQSVSLLRERSVTSRAQYMHGLEFSK